MASPEITCLCLGPKQSGKTHLLTSLQAAGSVTNVSHSVPTIGTNIFRIKLPERLSTTKITGLNPAAVSKHRKSSSSTSKSSKNREINVLEIGGSMAPMWKNYLSNVAKIIYVVDTSNLCQISAAGVLLYTLLADPRLQRTKILLVLTKMDLAYRQMRNEALLMLQFEKLKKQVRQTISIVETSAITCVGHDKVLDWLMMP